MEWGSWKRKSYQLIKLSMLMVWVRFYYFHRFCSLSCQKCPNFRLLEGMTPLVQHMNDASKTTGFCTCMGQTNVNKLISVVHTCVMRMQISNGIPTFTIVRPNHLRFVPWFCFVLLSHLIVERWNVYIMCRGKPIFVFVYVICFSSTDLCHSFRVKSKIIFVSIWQKHCVVGDKHAI